MVTRFRDAPCPICAETGHLLNGFRVSTVKSFVILSQRQEHLIIACPACVERAAKKAMRVCLAFGWWCFPWGPVHTISALLVNSKARRAHAVGEPTQELREYVVQNPGHVAFLLKRGLEPLPTEL